MVNAANALDAFRSDKSRLNLNSSADYFSVQRSIPVNGQFYLISITGSTRFSPTRYDHLRSKLVWHQSDVGYKIVSFKILFVNVIKLTTWIKRKWRFWKYCPTKHIFIIRNIAMGSNMSKSPIQTDERLLYCHVCEERWIVHFPSYSEREKRPDWLNRYCGHWDWHEWQGFIYR